MKTYTIEYTETYTGVYEVEAETEIEAVQKLEEDIFEGRRKAPDCCGSEAHVLQKIKKEKNIMENYTVDLWGNEWKCNEEFIKATKLSEEILQKIGDIRNDIDKLNFLTDNSKVENKELQEQRSLMVEYMTKEAKELEKSVDSFNIQTY